MMIFMDRRLTLILLLDVTVFMQSINATRRFENKHRPSEITCHVLRNKKDRGHPNAGDQFVLSDTQVQSWRPPRPPCATVPRPSTTSRTPPSSFTTPSKWTSRAIAVKGRRPVPPSSRTSSRFWRNDPLWRSSPPTSTGVSCRSSRWSTTFPRRWLRSVVCVAKFFTARSTDRRPQWPPCFHRLERNSSSPWRQN